jgi:general secretion pathway protein D
MTPMQGVDASPFTFSIDEYGFTSVFGVAQQNQNVKILSAPSIVTTHNKEATVNVSETQALITETTSYETSAYPQTKSTIDWKDIGIILKVTPLIGENGVVQMNIKQTVESVVRTQLINDVSQPIIGKREAESFVSAANGETIVLAGLQQTKSNKIDGEVFALADIPLIGNLFKPNQEKVERTELIIFIRPTVVKSETASNLIAKEGIEKSQVSKQVKQYFKTGKFHDQDNDTMGKHKYSSLEKTLLHPEDDEDKAEEKNETSDAKKEEVKSDNKSETNAQLVE